jgi:N-formylglutamate amidohydrolase
MNDFITIKVDGETPLVACAIHNGHQLSERLISLSALEESVRFREEDPFTGIWTEITENRIIAHHSRFEFDLNRPPEKAIYLVPEDAWGLQVWKTRPPEEFLDRSREAYMEVYKKMHEGLTKLVQKFGTLVVFDLHSYNYRRNGPDAPPEDATQNPEINVGTGTMNRDSWAHLVDRFIDDLRRFDFLDRHLDVRENIKFKGGYFPRWIHEKFAESVCCISIEAKKFFMDEWTGMPDHSIINAIGDALKSTLPGIMEELSKRKSRH